LRKQGTGARLRLRLRLRLFYYGAKLAIKSQDRRSNADCECMYVCNKADYECMKPYLIYIYIYTHTYIHPMQTMSAWNLT
jgi:hypothetical protein